MTCDPLGRIIERRAEQGERERFEYNLRGQLVDAHNPFGLVQFDYDADGRLVRETQRQQGGEATLENIFDAAARLTSQTQSWRHAGEDAPAFSQKQRFGYDVRGLVTSQQIDEHEPVRFGLDAEGRIRTQRVNAQLSYRFDYDAAGRLARHSTKRGDCTDDSTEYQYDQVGNLTQRRDSRLGTDAYRYDPLGRIVAHMDPAGEVRRFVHDRAGDRFSVVREDDEGRTLRHHEGTVLRMDRAGQTIARRTPAGAVQELEWDEFGRLRRLLNEKGERWEYLYDALSRRICKGKEDETARTWFVWNGPALAAEVVRDNADRSCVRFFAYQLASLVPLAMQTSKGADSDASISWYQNDANGAPVRLRASDGTIVWEGRYDVCGANHLDGTTAAGQPIRLQGQYFDAESGLHYNRYRYFDPSTGCFISQDPIGLAGGINPYGFGPNVFGWVDPLGLSCNEVPGHEHLPSISAKSTVPQKGSSAGRVTISDNKVHIDGKPASGSYDFVITNGGELKLGAGHYHLSGGAESVKGAGTAHFENGKFDYVTNNSGHYQPTNSQLAGLGGVLKGGGLTTPTVDFWRNMMIEAADFFSTEIIKKVTEKNYNCLEEIMADLFRQKDHLLVLAQLSGRLPSVAFEAFFLLGLKYLVDLDKSDIKYLVDCCAENDIALYNIARFLVVHGEARQDYLKEIGLDSEKYKEVGFYDFKLNKQGCSSDEFASINKKLYIIYGASQDDVINFKEALAR